MSDIAFELEDAPIFQGLSGEELMFLKSKVRLESHTPGESLLHFGHDPPGLYVIRSGLVTALVPSETGAEREVATIGKGECLGEMALLTGEPCSATVRTISDTQAWLLDTAEFTEFVEHYPTVWRNLSRILSQRLMRRNLSMRSYANTTALVLDCPDDQSSALALAIAESLAGETGKRTLLIDARDTTVCPISQLTSAPLSPSIGQLSKQRALLRHHRAQIDLSNGSWRARIANLCDEDHGELSEDEIVSVLESLQAVYDFVLLLLRPGAGARSSALVRRANAVSAVITDPSGAVIPSWLADLAQLPEAAAKVAVAVVTGSEDASHLIGEIELRFRRPVARLPISKDSLRAMALEHRADFERLEPGARSSVNRLVRQISKTQVGLALGAGAAKGFAHIGVLKLFEEERIPIDFIAGCSIGAVVGAMHAGGRTLRDIHRTMHGADQKLKRWTLPLRSVWSDSGLTELLRAPGPDVRFRDLDIPFAAVATDIRTGREVVIRSGLVWKAVQA
ncbi:MAG: cyclic nucleotide-binding domain-containing protein, partial [Acidimicrobiia bacterium]